MRHSEFTRGTGRETSPDERHRASDVANARLAGCSARRPCGRVHVGAFRRTCAPLRMFGARGYLRGTHSSSHLKGRRYLVGDGVTLADCAVGHLEGFKKMVPFDWSAFRAINAFYDPQAVGQRPA